MSPGRLKLSLILATILVLAGGFFIFPEKTLAAPGINKYINFQGKVVNTDGTNVSPAGNPYSFLFCIYTTSTPATACTAGANNDAIWRESKSITVTDGIFQTNLGDGTALPSAATLNVDGLFLGINFASNGQMTPLIQFTAAPYAFNADNANSLQGGTWGAPGAIGSTTPNAASFTTLNSSGITQLATTAGSTFSLGNSTGAATVASGGTSSWTNTAGGLTISTASSGTLALTSAGMLNLSAGSASTVTLANVANALNFDSNTLTIDAFNNRVGIGVTSPGQTLSVSGTLGISSTSAPFYTIFQGGAQAGNITYTLPTTSPVANGYALVSTTGGVMSWAAAGGMSNPMTNAGDIIYGGASGTPARLGGGASGYVLSFNTSTSAPQWTAPGAAAVSIGSNISGGTAGSVLFVNGSGQLAQDPAEFYWDNTQKHLGIGTTAVSGAAFTINEEVGADYIMQLKQSGVNKFVINNDGGVAISGVTANIVKTSSGDKSLTTDFEYTGTGTAPQLVSVTANQNNLELSDGVAAFTTANQSASASQVVGAGAHSIVRDDGKIIIIHGGGRIDASVWDGVSGSTMSGINVGIGSTVPNTGSISLKRPNGRFLMIAAGGGTNNGSTSVYDPWNVAIPAAGPQVCGGSAITTGTNAFMRPDGRYQIMCGGFNTTGVYDPNLALNLGYSAGPTAPNGTAFGAGAHALQRDDGTFMVMVGNGTTANGVFNPHSNSFAGTAPGLTSNVTTGAVSIRRQDGKYLVLPGTAGVAFIYDPTPTMTAPNGTFTSAPSGPTVVLADGAQIVWRQDGKYLLITGTSNTVNIVNIEGSSPTFTNGTQYNIATIGAGAHLVPRPDGKYQIIRGGASAATDTLDIGYVIGGMVGTGGTAAGSAFWESECISSSSINPTSTLSWTKNAEGTLNVLARTGTACNSLSAYRNIPNYGDEIGAAPGDNKVQIRVFLKRNFPTAYDQDWGLWRGLSQTKYRRRVMDPVLYDITINNSSLFHRSQFDLGIGVSASQDASGPVAANVNVAANGSLQLSQGLGTGYLGSTTNPTGNANGGAFQTHNPLNQVAGEGSIAMKRPNGTYMILVGSPILAGTSPAAPAYTISEIYDPILQTFTNNNSAAQYGSTCATGNFTTNSCVPNNGAAAVNIGHGSLAFKRPDGKFLVVNGKGSITGGTAPSGTTSIYDPVASTFSSGPTLAGLGVGITAVVGRGSQAMTLPNGNVLILHGNYSTNTSIYNPLQNTMIPGPTAPVVIGQGSIVIPRPDGAWLVLPGLSNVGDQTACALQTGAYTFDPYAMRFITNTQTMTGTGAGAFAFQRSDGNWVIVRGGGTATTCGAALSIFLYNPVSNQLLVSINLASGVAWGGGAMQRPDGSWLIVNGGTNPQTQIYYEKGGATVAAGMMSGIALASGGIYAGTAPGAAGWGPGNGAFNFQRDDGKYVQIAGMMGTSGTASGGTGVQMGMGTPSATVLQYDAGWVTTGTYKSEHLSIPDMDADSTLSWKPGGYNNTGITAEVKTASTFAGLQTASTREVINGGLINPSGGSTAVQVNFNFSRSFPSKEGIWSDVWMGNSSVKSQTWRVINNPILSEFKINKDKDLLNLQADGLSLFRVSSNGDIYTSANGAYRTGGADLAENYSSVEPLEKGEVVAIDPINDHSVKKSLYQNQPDILGVVSSDPGFVAGNYTEDSYPIALVGRVPVKVSTENGPIKVGDYLTAASVPGHAMRATKSGRVIGKALENLDPSKIAACPAGGYIIANRQCGTIMMFVNLTDYSGMPVEKLMAEVQASGQEMVATEASGETALPSQAFAEYSQQAEILAFLKDMQAKEAQNPNPSEILTGRLSADKEVITPQIFTDLLVAKTIRADRIEGLEFIQTGMENVQEGMENNTVQVKSLGQQIAELQGVVNTLNDKSGGLTVDGPAQFKGPAIFEKIAEFLDTVIFRNSVEFLGQVTFNKDTAGYAIVKEGTDRVTVTFAQKYANLPIINTSLSLRQIEDAEERQAAEDLLLVSDVKMIITNVTTTGFEIRINQSALSDIPFSWQAIAVKDAQTFESAVAEANSETMPLADIVPTSNTAPNLASGETAPMIPTTEITNETAGPLQSGEEPAAVLPDMGAVGVGAT